jgi:acetate kinase
VIALTVNVGSSTAKLALFRIDDDDPEPLGRTTVPLEHGQALPLTTARQALPPVPAPDVVGHRVVHGGDQHGEPELVDDALLDDLARIGELAPLHQPACLEAIRVVRAALPDIPQVACFDTAFHRSLDAVASTFPLPADARPPGVRRYGFHGLSYEWAVRRVGADELGRAVIAHLGSGASVCAVVDGRSVDTTMGLTPTGGLVMGTRSGDLDPGLVLHLVRQADDLDDLEQLLDTRSGLLGLSGKTSDMRELLAGRRDGDADAALAVEAFVRSARRAIAGAASVLGGIDSLVFTGGVGSSSAEVRDDICSGLSYMGVALDDPANRADAFVVSPADAAVTVRVVESDEEAVLALHSSRVANAQT